MQIWELTIHWRSGLKNRGLFATETLARAGYDLATQGVTHREKPPFEIKSRYVHQQAERGSLED